MKNPGFVWETVDSSMSLGPDEIHIWRVSLDLGLNELGRHLESFSSEERQRAKSYQRDLDRFRFIACRGHLRQALSQYLKIDPSFVQFGHGPNSKPYISAPNSTLCFNVARCEGLAVMAFSMNRQLGVDLELIREDVDIDSIAHHFFTPDEQALMQGVDQVRRSQVFFNCWTLKEAYVKADGQGIAGNLDKFDITRPIRDGQWRMQVLNFGGDSAASLVYAAEPGSSEVQLRYLRAGAGEHDLDLDRLVMARGREERN